MKVTLLVPTLNEIDGMKAIMPQIQREWVDQILVVDGHSTDGTAEYARTQGYDVVIQKKKGPRQAFNEAFPHVRGDVVITFSPDGNSKPEAIPQLIEKMKEGYDMVIASRYKDGAKSYDDDWMTGFGNWLFTTLVNLLHGARYTDAMVIYRAYRTKLFVALDLDKDDSYKPERWLGTVVGIEPLLSVRCAKMKLRVTEIPADEPPRMGGERKLDVLRWGGAYLLQFFRELYYWNPRRARGTLQAALSDEAG